MRRGRCGLPADVQGTLVVVAVLAVASLLGLWLRASGRRLGRAAVLAGDVLSASDIGATLGERATLVQFSSAFCQPCRATRRVLDAVSSQVDGVRHVEIDAESNLELVRRLDVRRTPTVLVLDRDGRVVRRASGAPRPVDVLAALGVVGDE